MSSFLTQKRSKPVPIDSRIESSDGHPLFASVQGSASRLHRGIWTGMVEIKSDESWTVPPGETVRLVEDGQPSAQLVVMSLSRRMLHFRSQQLSR